jgi:hypothetical protein
MCGDFTTPQIPDGDLMEPRWRTMLNWVAVITFFTMPFVVFWLRFFSIQYHWEIEKHWGEFKGLGSVFQTITALVFGLSGLRSFDKAWETKHNNNKPKDEPKAK